MTCGPQFIFLLLLMGSAYDANGNLTTVGTGSTPSLIYNYDAEDQLIRVVRTNAAKSEFTYDGLGRRRVRREFRWTNNNWQATGEVRYVYDGGVVLQERHFNTQPSTNSPQRTLTYTRGLDLSGSLQGAGGVSGLLALSDQRASASNPTNYYYHADGSGNVTALLNQQSEVVARYLYDPFGNLLAKSGPMADFNRVRFSSKEWHAQSGLLHYEFRAYDPNLQRWLNQDPLEEAGGINLHRFVLNNSVTWVDTDGLQPANVAVPPRVTVRNTPNYGVITEEILESLRHNRTYRASPEQLFNERALRNARERELSQRFPGHKPGNTYLTVAPPPPQKPTPCPPNSLSDRNAPPGLKLSRNWGGDSGPFGQSWTRDLYSSQSRNSLGLETANSAEFLSIGRLLDPTGVTTRRAQRWGRFEGGGDEVLVPNANEQIRLDAVVMPDTPLPYR